MAQANKTSRTRRAAGDTDELAVLRKRRAELDARNEDRRRREDDALKRFAAAAAKARKAREAGEAKAVDLEHRAADVREKAEEKAAEQDGEQAAALLQLHELGRSAEDLATLTAIPVKKVRAMINSARWQAAAESEPEPPAKEPTSAPEPSAAAKPAVVPNS